MGFFVKVDVGVFWLFGLGPCLAKLACQYAWIDIVIGLVNS